MNAVVQTAPLLEMRGISKAFPGVRALDGVSMTVHAGEVHMLLGQNGAGKSTLIKALYGAVHPDEGEFLFNGKTERIHSAADARRLGVAVIFQEFSLVPYLSVAENIYLGREFPSRVPGLVDHRRMRAEARRLLDSLGMSELDAAAPLHGLGVAQQQMVEIAKALSQNARILVMDEPTAAISGHEIERLFERIRTLKSAGIGIVYISHRLREVFEIGDRITVLRDGRNVAALAPLETTVDALVRLMAGRDVNSAYRRQAAAGAGPVALETRALCAANGLRNATITVRAGEIVGLAGLVGSGRTEFARALFGADRIISGEARLNGEPLPAGPAGIVRRGVGFVPESRKSEGLALIRSVQDNLLVSGLRRRFPNRWYRFKTAAGAAATLIQRLRIATSTPRRRVQTLSGGNQQKVVIGKWLEAGSRFFIFDEPTRGIDVAAKTEIFGLIDELTAGGAAAILISSELGEIASVCDRAYVMRDKTIVGELRGDELTEENILKLAMHHA
ncbi:MAG TPA: sugar ABC transporter ATP-binding protein [Terriglobia bacterium]|nr:sugar ABC transporter ATP-binding protein [Terriglobia bacterium]